jgi:hypothetical protein
MKRRCVLVIPDAGPINSLWVARRLDLLLKLEMPVVLIDEVYAETTRDPDHYAKDRDVQSFVEAHRDREILVEKTFVGSSAAVARARGDKLKSNLGDAAIAEFLNDANEGSGINKYLQSDEPVLLLFEDADLRSTKFIKKTDNLHLLSTVAFLRGMEAVGLIESAQEVIQAMTNPSNPRESRKLNDLPDGTDDEARIGSLWKPTTKGE